ncbi:MAG: histidine phosphatase family protein [Chloroflexi bacterium]|nr:histidine phosphatase family protein [Chloroflexota bacterium]
MRHSTRFPILDRETQDEVPLTPEGIELAKELGKYLGERYSPGRLYASMVNRCVVTAESIAMGAGWQAAVQTDVRLTHPYIRESWHGLPAYVRSDPLPAQVYELVDLLKEDLTRPGQINLYVTHDTIIGTMVGYLLGEAVNEFSWPTFLEGIALWLEGDSVMLAWRSVTEDITTLVEVIETKGD